MGAVLQEIADSPRRSLDAAGQDGQPKLVHKHKVGFVGFGMGCTLGITFLSADFSRMQVVKAGVNVLPCRKV